MRPATSAAAAHHKLTERLCYTLSKFSEAAASARTPKVLPGCAGMKHRNVYIPPEVMVAQMKRRSGIRALKSTDVLEIARTIVDETQLHTETISILQKAAIHLEEAKAWYLADEIRDLIEKIRNAEGARS